MSGHSKWSTIKRKKAKTDAQRGRIFTKLLREITSAAKQGGGDPNANPRLRLAVDKAKGENVPGDNIQRAIERATGSGEGYTLDEVTYEGYGAGGVAILIDAMTDNKNRTVSEVRNIFTKNGGNMGSSGCVAWMFHRKGVISFDKSKVSEDDLSNAAISVGAEDIELGEENIDVITGPDYFSKVLGDLKSHGFEPMHAEISMNPQTTIKLIGEDAQKVLKLVSALEEHDDVQNVYANFDISDEELEKII